MPEIDVEIDALTASVVDRLSLESLATTIISWAELTDSQRSESASWRFDWKAEAGIAGRVIVGLLVEGSPTMQGLLSLEDAGDHVFVHLIESAPHNVGAGKVYQGVAGNLFAFACAYSLRQGYEGFVVFTAKTELIEHYIRMLGASQIGSSQRMMIDAGSALKLFTRYFKETDQWPS